MKKLIVITVLVILAASIAAKTLTPAQRIEIKIELNDGTILRGNLLYRDSQVFWIQTKEGKTPVLEKEIKEVTSKKGEDITADFMAQDGEPPSKIIMTNAHTIGVPIWILAIITAFTLIRSYK